jgi:hypothetical protein
MNDTETLRSDRDRDWVEPFLPSILNGVPLWHGLISFWVFNCVQLGSLTEVAKVGTDSLNDGLVSIPDAWGIVNFLRADAGGES